MGATNATVRDRCLAVDEREGYNLRKMASTKAAPKKLVAKAGAKKRPAKAKPRRQMTVARAEKYAISTKDGRPIDIVAFLRTLR